MTKKKNTYFNREISWLSFNDRVLQEANDENVPLLERLKFLGIFSSNLDEFFRVRVATNKRILLLKNSPEQHINKKEITQLLNDIYNKVIIQQAKFNKIYNELVEELKKNKVFFLDEKMLTNEQLVEVKKYFKEEITNTIFPLMLDGRRPFPFLRDNTIYLACKLTNTFTKNKKYALIPLPTKIKKRFYQLPDKDGETNIMFIDDVIRANLDVVFSSLDYHTFEAYTIKLTRDAEMDVDNDLSINIVENIKNSLKLRKKGLPVRLIYDAEAPKDLLRFINQSLKIKHDELIPGQRYHNFRDFIKFPNIKKNAMRYEPLQPLYIPELDLSKNIFEAIQKKDYLLNHPYQPFTYVIRFLREAAIDPHVTTIKITLYRVAENSNVVNALINAVKNGKKVIVLMELRARFDEEHNIFWSNKLKEEGATVLYGVPGYKVHTKMCLIYRKENKRVQLYAHLGTGNYNGDTAKLYCDHAIFTSNNAITSELHKVFELINDFKPTKYKFTNLLVSPVNLRVKLLALIDKEIKNHKAGKKAYIIMKMNSLVDTEIIDKLYEASRAGVPIDLIIRGICCLVPGIDNQSKTIKVISIVDKFLEHARIYLFGNLGKEKIYMGSADLMTRNIDYRIEVCFPILDNEIKNDIRSLISIQLKDNLKSRIIDQYQINDYTKNDFLDNSSQDEFYNYLKTKI
ncbi:MAG: polyphosphate kinase 1 [Bacteroidota bacterium]|nr:polyphosphate kinase 1 [Bacteroidota bacterium]